MNAGGRHLVDPELLDMWDSLSAADVSLETLPALRATWCIPEAVETHVPSAAVDHSIRSVKGPDGAPDVEVYIYRPAQRLDDVGCIFYMHGGGYIGGDAAALEQVHRSMSHELRCIIVAVIEKCVSE